MVAIAFVSAVHLAADQKTWTERQVGLVASQRAVVVACVHLEDLCLVSPSPDACWLWCLGLVLLVPVVQVDARVVHSASLKASGVHDQKEVELALKVEGDAFCLVVAEHAPLEGVVVVSLKVNLDQYPLLNC